MAYKGVPFFQQEELTSVRRMRESGAVRLPDGSGFSVDTVKTHEDEGGPGSGPQGGKKSRFAPPVGKAAKDRAGSSNKPFSEEHPEHALAKLGFKKSYKNYDEEDTTSWKKGNIKIEMSQDEGSWVATKGGKSIGSGDWGDKGFYDLLDKLSSSKD